jgi:NAD-dependent deacetylase
MPTDPIQAAAECLIMAQSVCVSTGAGMSAESGVETFRGEDGLWSKVRIEDFATPEAFQRDPEKVWAWYRERRQKIAQVEPHDGHRVLAHWEERVPNFTLVTQNIDGLHHRAGSRNVVELHGRLDCAKCTYCDYNVQTLDDLGPDPACPVCQKRMRPDVVWFGEMLPQDAIATAFESAEAADTFIVIGTSGVVQPAASLVQCARGCGAHVIEVNPNPSEFTSMCDVSIRAGCREALTAIDAAWRLRDA